jgi:RimJ/RimL family protein N-acetyltransferase
MDYDFIRYTLKVGQTDNLILKPFEPKDFDEGKEDFMMSKYASGYYRLFSNSNVLEFNVNKKIETFEDAVNKIYSLRNDSEKSFNYDYWIFTKRDGIIIDLVGNIRMLPLELQILNGDLQYLWVTDFLGMQSTRMWFVEYYLNQDFWNRGIITMFLKYLTENFFEQGFSTIGALVDVQNSASISVLTKAGFCLVEEHDKIRKNNGGKQQFYVNFKN